MGQIALHTPSQSTNELAREIPQLTEIDLIPSAWRITTEELSRLGQIGDYIGGFWGTILTFITTIFIIATFISTKNTAYFGSIQSILVEMLKTHDNIVSISRDRTPLFLREFSKIYKISKRLFPDISWSIDERIDICYTLAFYGLSSQTRDSLSRYGENEVRLLSDEISRLKNRNVDKFGNLFLGQQEIFSHYFRNLFSIYALLEESKLSKVHKLSLGKIVRSKLSNYDQAILMLNVISHLGQEWERRGFIEKYKPFANVPKKFFGFDADFLPKNRFPAVEFEWENLELLRAKSGTKSTI
jgi:hypothetical protein